MAHSLYICYFGLTEALVQTQVLPYLRELRKDGHKISLLTFEGNVAGLQTYGVSKLKDELTAQGIDWHWLNYHKRFSVIATAYDVFRGALFVRRRISSDPIDVLHGRVHIPVLMAALARKFSKNKPKVLFDIRGFFPEEYTDAGRWPENGWLFRTAKRVEKWLLKESDGFVVLTEKAREILFPESVETGADRLGRPVEVIPCCIDSKRFENADRERSEYRREIGVEERFVVVHTGSLGGLYLTNEIVDLLEAFKARVPSTFAMILTQGNPNLIVPLLAERGFAEGDFLVTKVPPNDVPQYLVASDVGLSFVKIGEAAASRSPTKIPEYLAAGLPVIGNRGVGDVDGLIEDSGVGVLLNGFADKDLAEALIALEGLGDISKTCRATALARFDLETVGGQRYRRLYAKLGNSDKLS